MNIGFGIEIGFSQKNRRVIVRDTFNRVDNSSAIGNAETGQTWVNASGTWGIVNGEAYCSVLGSGVGRAVIDSGASDVRITVRLKVTGGTRILLRYTDGSNEIAFVTSSGAYTLNTRITGTFTEVGRYTTTPTAGDIITITAIQDQIKVYLNGALIISYQTTFNQSATIHGLSCSSTNIDGRYDDFIIEEI